MKCRYRPSRIVIYVQNSWLGSTDRQHRRRNGLLRYTRPFIAHRQLLMSTGLEVDHLDRVKTGCKVKLSRHLLRHMKTQLSTTHWSPMYSLLPSSDVVENV